MSDGYRTPNSAPPLAPGQRLGLALLGIAGVAGVIAWNLDRTYRTSAPVLKPNWPSTVIAEALAQLGKPYLWGGNGPDSFDCSGLMNHVFKTVGVKMPRRAGDIYNVTAHVPYDALRPGDMVFFGTPLNVHHVGLYIGNGKMIHAPHGGTTVSVSTVLGARDFLAGGRVA